MYLNIGGGELIRKNGIVGIFDLDTSTIGQITKEYLKRSESEGRAETVGDGIPKAYVVTTDGRVYITTRSASSLRGRNKDTLSNL